MTLPMYPAQVNSPATRLAGGIDALTTIIAVLDASVLPEAPNILSIGHSNEPEPETIRYEGKEGNALTGVTRGFQGPAKAWAGNTPLARMHTAYDHDTLIENIRALGTFTHVQTTPAAVWTIEHNKDKHPSVAVVDSTGRKVYGEIKYISSNVIQVTFSGAFSGKAYLN